MNMNIEKANNVNEVDGIIVSEYFRSRNTIVGTTDRLCFLMSYTMLLHRKNALSMQLPDLFSIDLHGQVTSRCTAIVATNFFEKKNKDGKLEVCLIGAFASSFFSFTPVHC